MKNFTQIYIMLVFGVKNRRALLSSDLRPLLYKAIRKIAKDHCCDSKIIALNGIEDHIHILIELSSSRTVADFVREVKSRSSRWINDNRLTAIPFEWQRGYGAFSYSHSAVGKVINYIENQEEHHKKFNFRDEFAKFLENYGVNAEPRDLPKEPS